jgi:5-(carboxyamino)imidazole ribonucleotide mutase
MNPVVGIIMGSDSDLPTMKQAAEVLDDLGVPNEVQIVSAHRTPEWMSEYAKTARERGIKVIIAGAGGAAHLPGMTEAFGAIPVIGVPIKSSALAGVDSLFSIVQMPPGRPVGTMAIGGAKNAGIYAAQILAMNDAALFERVEAYKAKMEAEVVAKNEKLQASGFKRYLEDAGLI